MSTFETTLWSGDGRNTGIQVPEEVVIEFGRGKRVPVTVTIDGDYSYRSTIAVMGGMYLIPVAAAHRKAAGIAAGDPITVTLEVDDAPRTVTPPPELAAALEVDPAAKEAWEKLSYSHQRRHALAIEDAKAPETKARRVAKAVEMLRGS